VDGWAFGFDAFGGVASTAIHMSFGPVASRAFFLLFRWTFLLLTCVFLAAVSVGFGNKLVTRVITLRFGIARNQGFGFAPAAVNPSLHVRLARFADVSVVVFARFVLIDGAVALVHLLLAVDRLGNGTSALFFAFFRHARSNICFALIAVDRFALAARIFLALFAVGFFGGADPLFAAALEHSVRLRGFRALVAVQQLFRLLLRQAFFTRHAFFAGTGPWFAVGAGLDFRSDGQLRALITSRVRGGCRLAHGNWHAASCAVRAGGVGTRHGFLAGRTRFFRWNGLHAVVLQAVTVVAVRQDVITLAARPRRRASLGFARAVVGAGAVDVADHDQFLAFGAFFAGNQIRVFLFRLLPGTHFLPITVRWLFFAQEFVDLDGDGRFLVGFGEVFGRFDDDILDESNVHIVILYFHRLHQADVLADFVHDGRALISLVQGSGGDHDVAFFEWDGGIVDLLGRAGAGNLDLDGGFGQRHARLLAVGQLGVGGQSGSISHLHFHRVFHLRLAHFESGVKFADWVFAAAFVFGDVLHVTSFAFFRLFFYALFFLAAFDGLRAGAAFQERLVHRLHAIVRAFPRLGIGFDAFGGSCAVLAGDLEAAAAIVLLHVHDLTSIALRGWRARQALAVRFVLLFVFVGTFLTKDLFLFAAEALFALGFAVASRLLRVWRFQNARVVRQASTLVGFGNENVAFFTLRRFRTSFLFALFHVAAASFFLNPVFARVLLALGCVVDGAFLGGIIAEICCQLLAVGDDAAVVFAARLGLVWHVEDGLGLVTSDRCAFVVSFSAIDQGPAWTRIFFASFDFFSRAFLVLSGFDEMSSVGFSVFFDRSLHEVWVEVPRPQAGARDGSN